VVLAVAGDTVRFGPPGVVVNGSPIPNTRPLARDGRGRPLMPARYGVYVLGAGEVWLWSPFAVSSYDSRYFGPVPVGGLVSRVRPVLTAADWTPWVAPGAPCTRGERS
jgi:type IV secretory pathway protease TraF